MTRGSAANVAILERKGDHLAMIEISHMHFTAW